MINKSIGMPISRHIITVLVVNIKCPTDGSLLETVVFMLAYHSLFRERILCGRGRTIVNVWMFDFIMFLVIKLHYLRFPPPPLLPPNLGLGMSV